MSSCLSLLSLDAGFIWKMILESRSEGLGESETKQEEQLMKRCFIKLITAMDNWDLISLVLSHECIEYIFDVFTRRMKWRSI